VYRGTIETQELFLAEVDLLAEPLQISVEPQFPAYIDNVGVLGFTADGSLSFFAGDVTISGVDLQEMIGAADLYLAQLPVGGPPTIINQSLTSGQLSPPYEQPGQLSFSEAVLDPLGHRYLLVGESPAEDQTLTSVSLLASPYGEPVLDLLGGLDSDPVLVGTGYGVLVVSKIEGAEDSSEDAQRLDLLPSLHAQPDGALVPVGLLPKPLVADRFCSQPQDGWIGLAVSLQPGFELPVLLHSSTGAPALPITTPFGLPSRLAFEALGRLVVGFGAAQGPYKFVALEPEGGIQLLGSPIATGFPLGP